MSAWVRTLVGKAITGGTIAGTGIGALKVDWQELTEMLGISLPELASGMLTAQALPYIQAMAAENSRIYEAQMEAWEASKRVEEINMEERTSEQLPEAISRITKAIGAWIEYDRRLQYNGYRIEPKSESPS